MKKILLSVVAGLLSLSALAEWKTDFNAAQAVAKKEGRPMLLNFTGSDWCSWCVKMKKDVLDVKAFKDFADKGLVLVEVDFPNAKKQSAAEKKANEALKDKYAVAGFPTFLLVDANGKELGRQVGYLKGGPDAFIGKIEEWKKTAK